MGVAVGIGRVETKKETLLLSNEIFDDDDAGDARVHPHLPF